MKYDVLGLGNPLIDIIVNIDESILKELNLEKGSMNLVDVKRQQEILNKCKNIKRNTALGGSCANTMSMIAQLGGRS
ncbi:adenosine kinase, partial [bacterium]|nr:adenosine kinase [bacterium]